MEQFTIVTAAVSIITTTPHVIRKIKRSAFKYRTTSIDSDSDNGRAALLFFDCTLT